MGIGAKLLATIEHGIYGVGMAGWHEIVMVPCCLPSCVKDIISDCMESVQLFVNIYAHLAHHSYLMATTFDHFFELDERKKENILYISICILYSIIFAGFFGWCSRRRKISRFKTLLDLIIFYDKAADTYF